MHTLSCCLTMVNETEINLPISLKRTRICFPKQLLDWPTNCGNSFRCYMLGEGRRAKFSGKKKDWLHHQGPFHKDWIDAKAITVMYVFYIVCYVCILHCMLPAQLSSEHSHKYAIIYAYLNSSVSAPLTSAFAETVFCTSSFHHVKDFTCCFAEHN